jgi:hypothetical protein
MPLNEVALRQPTFRGGIPLTLGDGQEWTIPKPVVRFGLSFDEGDDSPTFRRKDLGFGPDYMEVLQSFYDTEGVEQLNVAARMVCRVLKVNYALDNEALATLLPYVPNDDANQAIWGELVAIATGNPNPKIEPEDDI